MILNTALELYDLKIIPELQKKFSSIPDTNWNYSPPDLAFGFAFEKFGDSIFPLYNVFRIDVPQLADERYSIGNFTIPIRTGAQDKTVNFFKVFLRYQVDFYSNSMYDMNMSIMDFYRMKKQRQIDFDFSDMGLPGESYPSEIIFEDPEDNTGLDDSKVYSIGRYYRYTYTFTIDAVIFDINQEILAESIVVSFYDTVPLPETKLAEIESRTE